MGMFALQELAHQAALIRKTADDVFAETGSTLQYKIGTMIEIPRAALVANEVRIKVLIPMHRKK
jgi:pyruvate,orthophosphate dikinase